MLERDRGGILNVASTAAFQPLATMAVYGATKAFVLSFTEALWAETRTTGVRVMALCPLSPGRRTSSRLPATGSFRAPPWRASRGRGCERTDQPLTFVAR